MKFLLFLLSITSLQAEPLRKVLVLIIASDNMPIFLETQKVWRSYMHSDPEHIEAYFIRGDPTLATPYRIDKDVIWAKSPENYGLPILKKTIGAFEAMMPRLHEFDYVLRTNLASFIVFPRLLKTLETLPRTQCYYGANTGGTSVIASGSGFVLSRDLVEMVVKDKTTVLNMRIDPPSDDVILGYYFRRNKIYRTPGERIDLLCLDDWFHLRPDIPPDVFHFRIKTEDHLRIPHDLYIHGELLKIFYGLNSEWFP